MLIGTVVAEEIFADINGRKDVEGVGGSLMTRNPAKGNHSFP